MKFITSYVNCFNSICEMEISYVKLIFSCESSVYQSTGQHRVHFPPPWEFCWQYFFWNLIICLTECRSLASQVLGRLRVMGTQAWRAEDSSFPARGIFSPLNSFISDNLRSVTAVINLLNFYHIYHCLRSILFLSHRLDFSPLRPGA